MFISKEITLFSISHEKNKPGNSCFTDLFVFVGVLLILCVPVIPDALMNTLPFRLSFPFESTDRPKLKMDFHFFDFPENFLLEINRHRHLFVYSVPQILF